MTPLNEGQKERIRAAVIERVMNHREGATDSPFYLTTNNPDNFEHVVQCGVSILMTKWGVGYPGGSFVQAIVNNDLTETFGRADSVNVNCIRFYVSLVYNQSYIA